jgi:hypothetical protein
MDRNLWQFVPFKKKKRRNRVRVALVCLTGPALLLRGIYRITGKRQISTGNLQILVAKREPDVQKQDLTL